MKKKQTQKGFSVLFASLVGSLVLAIGLAILSITIKQITLSSAGRESQKAFYAADTGTEFALFLDRGGDNATACPDGIFPVPGASAICGIDNHPYVFDGIVLNDDQSGGYTTTDFLEVESSDSTETVSVIRVEGGTATTPICFDVFITKISNDGGITVATEIESRGFSTCNVSATNRFERAIRTFY